AAHRRPHQALHRRPAGAAGQPRGRARHHRAAGGRSARRQDAAGERPGAVGRRGGARRAPCAAAAAAVGSRAHATVPGTQSEIPTQRMRRIRVRPVVVWRRCYRKTNGYNSRMRVGRLQRALYAVVVLLLTSLPVRAFAALTIEIVGTGANQFPIAIVPFRAEAGIPQPLTPVIAADLARSGVFRTIDAGGLNPPPYEPHEVNWSTWRARGADAVVIGSVAAMPNGRYEVRFRLMDVVK